MEQRRRLMMKRREPVRGMLIGGQAKLDKNKNGRIDAQDFKILKADIPTYLESDKDLIELQHKISYNKTIVTYLEQVLRSINNRTFTIKNAIEWKKFEAGVI